MVKRQPENIDQPVLPIKFTADLIQEAAALTGLSPDALAAPGGLEYAQVVARLGRMGCNNCGATDCPGCGR